MSTQKRRTALSVLNALGAEGYDSYFVGGAVRDKLLGFVPKDYDIITTALPQEVKHVADKHGWKTKNLGASFGVILVIVEGCAFEVTTARQEWYDDRDAHRPAGVSFCSSIEEDLFRRDFTINAVAEDKEGNLLDPFGGAEDLQRKIIRSVGDPSRRLYEDALRAFRAARFSAQLGFDIDPGIFDAVKDVRQRIEELSIERVVFELEKTLIASYPQKGFIFLMDSGLLKCNCRVKENGLKKKVPLLPELTHLAGLPQNPRFHQLDAWEHTLEVISNVPAQKELRWAALLHDVAKGLPGVRGVNRRGEFSDPGHDRKGAEITKNLLYRLKISPATAERVTWLVAYHMRFPLLDEKAVLRWLRKLSNIFRSKEDMIEAVDQLFHLLYADLRGKRKDVTSNILEARELHKFVLEILQGTPFFVEDLHISGGEVARELGSGPQVKKFLRDLLTRVTNGELPNDPVALKKALKRKALRQKKLK